MPIVSLGIMNEEPRLADVFAAALFARLAKNAKPVHKRIVRARDLPRLDPELLLGSKICGFSEHHFFETDDLAIMLENPKFEQTTFPDQIPLWEPTPPSPSPSEHQPESP
jgi:hypothetical protein